MKFGNVETQYDGVQRYIKFSFFKSRSLKSTKKERISCSFTLVQNRFSNEQSDLQFKKILLIGQYCFIS